MFMTDRSALIRGEGGEEVREKVHKYSSFVHRGNSSQAGSKIQTT